jgi:hypothetical protein
MALESDDSIFSYATWMKYLQKRCCKRTFSGSGFAKYAQRFASLYGKAHPLKSVRHSTRLRGVSHAKIHNFEKRLHATPKPSRSLQGLFN